MAALDSMPTPAPTPTSTSTTSAATPVNALALLKEDHAAVNVMFETFAKTSAPAKKKVLVAEICAALSVHTQLEEELLYPAVQLALRDKLLVPEARVEHEGIKRLITQLRATEDFGEQFDARVKVLSEYMRHHVKEEQDEMFPKVKASSLDLVELGDRLAARKLVLLAKAARPKATP